MSAAGKKKAGAKDRLGVEGAVNVASVQSAFVSAARVTPWPFDVAASTTAAGLAAATWEGPTAFTAAANAVCGRPTGSTQLEDPWARAEGSIPPPHTAEELLPASPKWEPERSLLARLLANHVSTSLLSLAGRGGAALSKSRNSLIVLADGTRESDALYEGWLAYVAAHRSAPSLYPHHTLFFSAESMLPDPTASPATSATASVTCVASVLHRLLSAYLERCSEAPQSSSNAAGDAVARHGVPPRVFASLLGTSLYNNNYAGPPLEQKDVTFGQPGQEAAFAGSPRSVPSHRRYSALSRISSVGASHVCVCAGSHYYKLQVIDVHRGRLRSAAAIASGLEAIQHHQRSLAQTNALAGASPSVQQDHAAMEALFAQLSSVPDATACDVRRRLRAASLVNGYSLDALESALCVLLLKETLSGRSSSNSTSAGGTGAKPPARWLHSACCLEVGLDVPAQWAMRLQAAVVPCHAGAEWIERAASAAPHAVAPPPPPAETEPTEARNDVFATPAVDATTAVVSAAAEPLSTPVDEAGLVEYLELWLPEKHRVPLRPYPAPVWDAEATQHPGEPVATGTTCELASFVMSALAVCTEWKRDGRLACLSSSSSVSSAAASSLWPRVVVALQPEHGGAPTLLALNSPAMQHYYEALVAPPLLFAPHTMNQVRAAAAAEVQALLNVGWHVPSTVRSFPPVAFTAGGWSSEEAGSADVCISFYVRPRHSSHSGGSSVSAVLQRVVSDLGLPCSLLVNCTAQQAAAEAHLRASPCRIVNAVVQAGTPAALSLCRDFSAALASRVR